MSAEQLNYITNKYIEYEILNRDKTHNNEDSCLDANIYPDTGYIPICSQCSLDFENFKSSVITENMEVEIKHPSSCLWYDWFAKKIKMSCPDSKIVRKKTNRTKN